MPALVSVNDNTLLMWVNIMAVVKYNRLKLPEGLSFNSCAVLINTAIYKNKSSKHLLSLLKKKHSQSFCFDYVCL